MKCPICEKEFSPEVYPHHYKHCLEAAEGAGEVAVIEPNELDGIDLDNLIDADLEAMTLAQLKAIAVVKNVQFNSKTAKAELVKLIEDAIYA